MANTTRHIMIAIALATLGGVMLSETAGPAHASQKVDCVAASPVATRTQQQAAAAAPGSGSSRAEPDDRGPPQPSGAPPAAATGATAETAPVAVLTLTGSNLAANAPATCPSPTAAKQKATKTRSNIQNN